MSKPWLETWEAESDYITEAEARGFAETEVIAVRHVTQSGSAWRATMSGGILEHARLAAAAPALVRALLAVEHPENGEKDAYGKRVEECPSCLSRRDACGEFGHASGCQLDAALTLVGPDTQEKRDEARREIASLVKGPI